MSAPAAVVLGLPSGGTRARMLLGRGNRAARLYAFLGVGWQPLAQGSDRLLAHLGDGLLAWDDRRRVYTPLVRQLLAPSLDAYEAEHCRCRDERRRARAFAMGLAGEVGRRLVGLSVHRGDRVWTPLSVEPLAAFLGLDPDDCRLGDDGPDVAALQVWLRDLFPPAAQPLFAAPELRDAGGLQR